MADLQDSPLRGQHTNPGLGGPYPRDRTRDDPNTEGGAYCNPYHGPVPQTLNEGVHGAPRRTGAQPGHGDDVRWGWADGQPRANDVCGRADGKPGVAGGAWWDPCPHKQITITTSLPLDVLGVVAERDAAHRSLPLHSSALHVRIHALLTPYPSSFAPILTRAGGLRPRQAAVKR
ncbi:hypothetical protein B0H14DRAFT_3863660 [Mycena olivaceomarginata]|nr:hypothetical protein B0H14DRAFT_3863660 [Mycena olivaceomarginata]